MSKAKLFLMSALATMAFAASASAAVPSGYDSWVNVEKVTPLEARTNGYCKNPVRNMGGDYIAWPVNIEKVTPLEAKTDGYCHEIVKNMGGDFIAMPNQDGPSISEEQLEEMFKGNN